MNRKKLIGNAMLFLTAFIWGTAFVAQRVGMDHIEPFTFSASRYLLAALALIPIILFMDSRRVNAAKAEGTYVPPTPKEKRQTNKKILFGGSICGVVLFAASSFQQVGLVYTTAGKAGFITALYIVLVPIFGLFLRKKTSWLTWAGVAAATVGLYLLCVKEDFSIAFGDILEFICAIFFSWHILACDHFSEKSDPVKLSCVQFTVCFLLATFTTLVFENPTWAGIFECAVPIIYCGVFSAGVGYTLQMVAQKDTDPAVASLLLSLESVFGALGGFVLLHEILSLRELLGCIIMFTAVILAQIPVPGSGSDPETASAAETSETKAE